MDRPPRVLRARRALRLAASTAALLAAVLLARASAGPGPGEAGAGSGGTPRVLLLEVRAPISTGTAEYLQAGLERARAERFDAVAIELDTPGGHLEATRDIVQRLLASEVPVVV